MKSVKQIGTSRQFALLKTPSNRAQKGGVILGCKRPLTRIIWEHDIHPPKVIKHMSNEEWELNQRDMKQNHIEKMQRIPCGQCAGCRLEYSRQWATRCELEMKQWEHNWWLTLTYDDEHLPRKTGITEYGELIDTAYLKPDDLQQFMKSIRQKWKRHYNEDNIRFYACGEYGDEKKRPHYHIIMFNFNIRDLEEDHKNKHGNVILTSKEITDTWGKGLVGITHATWETAAYTARYMMKKQKGLNAKSYYEERGITPEFCRMSRMPGIAEQWYKKHNGKMWELDELTLANGRTIKPPKYYEELYDKEIEKIGQKIKETCATNEEHCYDQTSLFDTITMLNMLFRKEERKEKREKAAEISIQQKMQKTTLNYTEQLKIEERSIIKKSKEGAKIL